MLCAVRPDIGGVLIRGEKGTAKSTAVRALAKVLTQAFEASGDHGGQLVELPIGATEDRVVGSLDLQKVLRDGEHAFSPGLLARAHRGVLYVDEVNLLHDHLVDVLLDAAAMGRVHIERDGVSHSHDSRFVLIGTMNPEEGELRPQLLDRFGLTVDVAASRDVDVRVAVIRARLAYEAAPQEFAERYAAADSELAARISRARALLPDVVLPDKELRRIAALCAAFDVDGMRADLVVARTAVAHAAWRGASEATGETTGASEATGETTGASEATEGRITVDEDDIRVAAELALPHRRRRDPFDDPGLDPDRLDDAMDQAGQDAEEPPEPDPEPDPPGGGEAAPDESANGQAPQQDSVEAASSPQADGSPAKSVSNAPPAPTLSSAPPSLAFRTKALVGPGVGEG
ncbi:MAG: AAA family ATPase, partial [Mycobacterium sp.]